MLVRWGFLIKFASRVAQSYSYADSKACILICALETCRRHVPTWKHVSALERFLHKGISLHPDFLCIGI